MQNAAVLSQNATVIKNCDDFITKCDRYCKMRRLLQIATAHTFNYESVEKKRSISSTHRGFEILQQIARKKRLLQQKCIVFVIIRFSSRSISFKVSKEEISLSFGF